MTDEHDDDLEPEVDDAAEVETENFEELDEGEVMQDVQPLDDDESEAGDSL